VKYDCYDIRFTDDSLTYEFYSEGPAGKIAKRIAYTPFDRNGHVYNLSFGNIISDRELDDSAVTNNGDMEKVLFTVASTVRDFFRFHPGKKLLIRGSTESRTRLYRMMISKNVDLWIDNFEVLGLVDETFQSFENDIKYDAFIILQKSNFIVMEEQENKKSFVEHLDDNIRKHFTLDPTLAERPTKFSAEYLARQEAWKERLRKVKFPFPIGEII